jgi:hypothetical protein
MPKIKIIDHVTEKHVQWYCPGCQMKHHVPVGAPRGWDFNESVDNPTLDPSIRFHPTPMSPHCHSNITLGFIHFHGDSDHAMAGQVVEMVDVDTKPDKI